MVLNAARKSRLWLIVLAIFLLLPVFFFGLDYWNQLNTGIVETGTVSADCDLHTSACEANFKNDGKITFSITPTPVKPLVPLDLKVEVFNITAQTVQVDFEGIGIYMGYYRPELARQENNVFTGTASLSVCTLDKMSWQATVIIKTDKGPIIAPFRFEVAQK